MDLFQIKIIATDSKGFTEGELTVPMVRAWLCNLIGAVFVVAAQDWGHTAGEEQHAQQDSERPGLHTECPHGLWGKMPHRDGKCLTEIVNVTLR